MALLDQEGLTSALIDRKEVKSHSEFADSAALKLVVQDMEKAEAWIGNNWGMIWRETDILYQAPKSLSAWENTGVTRSSVSRFTVAKHINSIVPQMVSGIFYDDPPFTLRPRPGTTQETVRAKKALFSYQLDEMGFEEEVEQGFFNSTTFGTAIFAWGWREYTKKRSRYIRKARPAQIPGPLGTTTIPTKESDEFEVEDVEEKHAGPWLKCVDHTDVLVDPKCRYGDIRKANYVIYRNYLTLAEIEELRDDPSYDLPSKETLLNALFPPVEAPPTPGTAEQLVSDTSSGLGTARHASGRSEETSVDPTLKVFEVLERSDANKCIVVLDRKVAIKNQPNEFGVVPFYSCNWWNIPRSFWGLGIGRIIGHDQRVDVGLTNGALDILAFGLNPQYARATGANVPTQQIRQRLGGIVDVQLQGTQSVKDAFGLIETPKIPPEVFAMLQQSKSEAESATGANSQLIQGDTSGTRSSLTRTATGASSLAAATATRLQGPVGRFVRQVFIPWLYQMDELNRERLPMSTLRRVLGEELGEGFKLDEEEFLNARMDYEVLAGVHLAAKKAMAQALPLMIQIFENPTLLGQLKEMGYTVDVKELYEMIMEMSEWKNSRDLIRKMTPEEQQRVMQANQAMQKMQSEAKMADLKFGQQQQLIDQENEARSARDMVKGTLKAAFDEDKPKKESNGPPGR